MAAPTQSIIDTRADQMFPTLEHAGDRARAPVRRGAPLCGRRGAGQGRRGRPSASTIILAGEVEITQHDESGRRALIVTHGPGAFMGELAQLSGRPALVDAMRAEPVEALIIPPERLRALLVAEAELGERIMRALILRRVGLLETGAGGPVIVGRAEQRRRAAAAGLPAPQRPSASAARSRQPTPRRKALIERFHVDPGQLPIVLCPGGQLLRNPERDASSRAASAWSGRSIRTASTTWRSSAPVRPGSRPRSMPARKGLSVLVLDCRAFGGQAGASARIENYLGFPTGITGMALMARAYNQAQKFGVEMAIPDEVTGLDARRAATAASR